MTRIVAGSAKGRRLEVPKSGTRPTAERIREAMFSHLEHQGVVAGATVIDLYAGSGALGLEAASRGAEMVYLVEKSGAAATICRRNAQHAGLSENVKVLVESGQTFLEGTITPCDLIVADPPYDLPETQITNLCAAVVRHLRPQGIFVLERAARSPEPTWPAELVAYNHKKYGDSVVWYCEIAQSVN